MTQFARCFLLVFCQLAVGGLLALSVPPWNELERGFYKSSAGVFLSAALIGGAGTVYLRLSRTASGVGGLEAIVWVLFIALFALYLSTLWGDAMVARARLYASALLVGLAALAASAVGLARPLGALAVCLALAGTYASAAVLGSVTTGMLIGHWYLIDPGMEIEPFRRCHRFFILTLRTQIAVLAVTVLALSLVGPGGSRPGVLAGAGDILLLRVALGPLAALAIAAMIRRVLAIPQTMAATGLFYIATLAVLVGELLGRYLLFRTSLPL